MENNITAGGVTSDANKQAGITGGAGDLSNAGDSKENQPQTFNQEQVDKILSERLERESKKFDKSLAEKLTVAQQDWEMKSKLSQEQKEKLLREEQEIAFNIEKTKLGLRENRIFAKEKLIELDLSTEFIEFLLNPDQELMEVNINKFKTQFNIAVEIAVQAKLKGKTPTDSSNNANNSDKSKVVRTFI